jgi:hypothetical protein
VSFKVGRQFPPDSLQIEQIRNYSYRVANQQREESNKKEELVIFRPVAQGPIMGSGSRRAKECAILCLGINNGSSAKWAIRIHVVIPPMANG